MATIKFDPATSVTINPNTIRQHGLTREEIYIYFLWRQKCDLCDHRFPTYSERGPRNWVVDHDHGHCSTGVGCPDCVRGFLCGACNMMEGMVAKAVRTGWAAPAGRLADYWADPPFQRWRRRGPTRFGKQQ